MDEFFGFVPREFVETKSCVQSFASTEDFKCLRKENVKQNRPRTNRERDTKITYGCVCVSIAILNFNFSRLSATHLNQHILNKAQLR